jgi:hypothetical protein
LRRWIVKVGKIKCWTVKSWAWFRLASNHRHAVTGGRQSASGTKSPTKDCDATPSILAPMAGTTPSNHYLPLSHSLPE